MKKRNAIIKRIAIYNPSLRKISKHENNCKFSNMNLGKSTFIHTKDCSGNSFIYINKLMSSSKRSIIHYLDTAKEVPYAYINTNLLKNLDYIYWLTQEFSKRNIPIYLETDSDLPDIILNELSKNSFNIVQCNLSELSNNKEDYISDELFNKLKQLRRLPYKLKISGIYTIIAINPIIPTITKLENVLTLLSCEKYNFNHLILKFICIPKTYNTIEYVTYKNIRIDADYFKLNNNTWECANWYKQSFIKNISYLKKNLSYTICDEHSNCRCIDIKPSYRDEDIFFFN